LSVYLSPSLWWHHYVMEMQLTPFRLVSNRIRTQIDKRKWQLDEKRFEYPLHSHETAAHASVLRDSTRRLTVCFLEIKLSCINLSIYQDQRRRGRDSSDPRGPPETDDHEFDFALRSFHCARLWKFQCTFKFRLYNKV